MHSYIGWTVVVIGLFFILSSVVGLYRFNHFFNKIHAIGVSDSFGLPISLIGLSIVAYPNLLWTKLLLLCSVWLVVAPSNTSILASARALMERKS